MKVDMGDIRAPGTHGLGNHQAQAQISRVHNKNDRTEVGKTNLHQDSDTFKQLLDKYQITDELCRSNSASAKRIQESKASQVRKGKAEQRGPNRHGKERKKIADQTRPC